ncbi:glycosyltransferase [candidate division KSB1 bacterium]|nr:glycosyltransferase [candidate division KSB1 bacterium]
MIIVFFITLFFLAMVISVTVFNAFTAPMIAKGPRPVNFSPVSIIIPARNEQNNIGSCLASLCAQAYPDLEIIVINDRSTDNTAQIVREFSEKDNRIKLYEGKPLAKGWTGKNWACFQGSEKAKGDIFIFTDADNFHMPDTVSKTVGWIQNRRLGLLSAFPQQICTTLTEKLVVPVIDMLVYSLLPLWLTFYSKYPSLAAANGQWLAITKNAYEKIGGHQAVRGQIVEDVEISRLAKKSDIKILTAAGTDSVMGRMYSNWHEVRDGFAKNAFGLVSYQTVPFFLLLGLFLLSFVLPYFLLFSPFVKISLLMITLNLLIRVILNIKYRHPFWASVVLHPVGILLFIYICLISFIHYQKGHILWKGRSVKY